MSPLSLERLEQVVQMQANIPDISPSLHLWVLRNFWASYVERLLR